MLHILRIELKKKWNVYPAFVDQYMAILRILVQTFHPVFYSRFFRQYKVAQLFQSSFRSHHFHFPAFVDLYGNSSNSSHQFTRHLLTYMAILRILVTFSSSFYSSLDNKAQLSAVLSLSQQSSCVSLSPKYTGKRNFMCFRNLPSGCSCS